MADYIRQLSARDILGASLSIYVRNWRAILGIYLPPILPSVALLAIYEVRQSDVLMVVFFVLNFIISIFTVAALTIAVADLCLQRPISFARSWRVAFRHGGGQVLGTYLLSLLATFVGMLLLIIPGIVVSMMLMFSICVVVLEGIGGAKALRRSRELARGELLRNFGVVFLVSFVCYAVIFFVVFILAIALTLAAMLVHADVTSTIVEGRGFAGWAFQFGFNSIVQLAMPPILIAIVLLYYDMRARKEAFDSTALAKELLQ